MNLIFSHFSKPQYIFDDVWGGRLRWQVVGDVEVEKRMQEDDGFRVPALVDLASEPKMTESSPPACEPSGVYTFPL